MPLDGDARGRAPPSPPSPPSPSPSYIDIGANLTDDMYRGVYNGTRYHAPDLDAVLARARAQRVHKLIVTAGTLEQSREALALARTSDALYSTVGVHPTRCNELCAPPSHGNADDASQRRYLDALREVIRDGRAVGKVVAVGECGLDYARTQFCPPDVQRRGFELQFQLAEEWRLPLLLHNRDSADELLAALRRNRSRFPTGVVHSFDGSAEEARAILDLGLYIGVNGCSLKSEANLAVVRDVLPLERLVLETDCPYCEIRPSHASSALLHASDAAVAECWPCVDDEAASGGIAAAANANANAATAVGGRRDKKKYVAGHAVKGRNEPCTIAQVCQVVARLKRTSVARVAHAARRNTERVFFGDASASRRDYAA